MKRINLKKASVARADTIRTINRQIVLNYVRERAPISRAEIAHETALRRSTVSLIEGELKRAVAEYSVCRGLPSPRVIVSSFGEGPRLLGALSLVLARKFSSALTT